MDPLDRDDLRDRVGKALAAFLSGQAPRLDAISETLGPLQSWDASSVIK